MPMPALEKIAVETKKVTCDGGGGALGHPKVFLNMGEKDEIICPYCSRHYVFIKNTRNKTIKK